MRYLLRVFVLGLVALWVSSASAQWFARGDFNGWAGNDYPLVDQGGGYFTGSVTGLTPGSDYEYKIASEDWSTSYPGSNGKTTADASGVATFHFYDGTFSDGWNPSGYSRVGYDDHQQFDWELMGTPNDPDWSGGPSYYLTDMGNGLHRLVLPLDAASYEFKFRRQGDWSTSIGDNFGNSAANGTATLGAGLWAFELDLPGGRWRVTQVPEPATIGLISLAAVALLGFSRRRNLRQL